MGLRVGRSRPCIAAQLLGLSVSLAACDPTIVLGARASDADVGPDVRIDQSVDARFDAAAEAEPDVAPNPIVDAASEGVPTAEAEAGPTLLWSSDHETRDLSAWHQGGDTLGGEYVGFGTNAISSERAHGGTYSLKFSIDTSDGMDHTARAYRRAAPGPAYYSAWFYFNETHSSFVWWTTFLFRALTDPQNIETAVNLWDIGVERRPNGDLALLFFDHMTLADVQAPPDNVVPVGRWVHLEAYFEYAPPQSTHITIWQDGTQVMDLKNLGPASSDHLYWAIGNGANGLAPPASTIYVDDAAISTVRLGPK